MESFGDKLRACAYALLVHGLCISILLAGLFWTRTTRTIQLHGPVIQAELVGLSAAPKPHPVRLRHVSRHKTPPATAPQPEPPKPAPQPPSQPRHNDRVDREKVAELAAQKAEQAKRAEQERRHQEQVLLEKQQREERERMQQLQDIRHQREAADRRLRLEKQKLAQLMDLQKQHRTTPTPAQPVPEAEQARSGTNGADDSLQAQYQAAIQNAVTQNWLRPDSAAPGLRCMLHIVQIPGGDVISVQIIEPCNADPMTRNSIEQAVKRAAPLPYNGFSRVFQREINFNFTYDG